MDEVGRESLDGPAPVHISHDGLQAHVSEVVLRQSIVAKFMFALRMLRNSRFITVPT